MNTPRRYSSLALGLATVAALALPLSGASAAPAPTYIVTCLTQSVKPTELVLACADANRLVRKITWSGWGGPTARATGVLTWNDCTPTCVAGHFRTKAISFSAGGRKVVKGKVTYTTVTGPAGSWGDSSTTWTL